MPATTPTTPFPLGAYLGNPDNSSVANEATYEAKYSSFTADLGAAPQYMLSYVDQSQAVAQWAGNSQWASSSAAASVDAKNQTPVIALPLNSTAAGSATPDQQFQAFASGQYDGAIQGIVQAWVAKGFTNLVFRPGWEMNLQGSNYAGDSASSQADWVKAFQHVYTVLHQAAASAGINVQVVWNPGVTNYSNAEATTNLYPGDAYVDVVGADAYSDIHPYSDGGATPTYHDWNTGGEDTSVAQFIADPVNRAHYWSQPAATKWSSDGSNGHSQSLTSLIQFAQAHGKAFAVPETGAGNSDAGTDVSDDAAYPQWLAQQLAAAQAGGEKISFVNLWDSNGGGNYEFSKAADGKPAEAAAWAKYFGAAPVTVTPPAVTPSPVSAAGPVAQAPSPTAFLLTDTTSLVSLSSAGDAYSGPVALLQQQFIWSSPNGVAVIANAPNVFLHGGAGDDALTVTGGTNVIDGGGGSNFLVGAAGSNGGADTFFVDGRGGATTWSTIVNFHQGDNLTVWGFVPGMSTMAWTASDGVGGYKGLTLHSELAGAGTGVNQSATFAGLSVADVTAKMNVTTGSIGGQAYLNIAYAG